MVSVTQTPVDDPDARALLDEYVRMRAASFPAGQTYRPARPDPSTFEPPAGVFLLVRDDQGAAVGCGGIRRLDGDGAGIRYEVKHIYLAPASRGRGTGRLLLDELERFARGWGAAELVLDTHHTLEAAARLYQRSGFSPIAPYNDNPNATVWLGKPLTE